MVVSIVGVARRRRVLVVVAGGGPKPPKRELSPVLPRHARPCGELRAFRPAGRRETFRIYQILLLDTIADTPM